MPLFNLPAIQLPTGTRFYIAAFLAVFFFFFTKMESTTQSESSNQSKSTQ
ncbi:hypothetical protein [Tumebacillus flagellatus]|nr:hypothetical protein [Tumebacillus flagellatus]